MGLDRSYLPITRFGIQQSDGVTAISDICGSGRGRRSRFEAEIEVIHNFVNCDVYAASLSWLARCVRGCAEPDERLLVHLSNFRPVKRVTDVVEVFARVAKELPARLMLVGDGPDRTAAE